MLFFSEVKILSEKENCLKSLLVFLNFSYSSFNFLIA